jgi:hypothetical protein
LEALGIPDQVGHHDFYPNGTHYWPGFFAFRIKITRSAMKLKVILPTVSRPHNLQRIKMDTKVISIYN